MTRATKDCAGRRAGHEQEAPEEQRASDDRCPRLADERGERAADRHADPAAAVLAEQRHQPEEADADAEAERPHFEQVATRE